MSLLQWFFINIYEAVVRMPDRLAEEHNREPRHESARRLLGPGSPARYHIPAAPIVIGSVLAALSSGYRSDRDRPALVVGAGSSLAAAGLTAYLVRSVNLRLLDDGPPIGEQERQRLVARWHGVNRIRVGLLAVGALALERAAHSPRG